MPDEVTDKLRKERREFYIPKAERERGFYGTEFEIRLQNKLTQRAIARECADWMRRKATFRSNRGKAPMQQFACVQASRSRRRLHAAPGLHRRRPRLRARQRRLEHRQPDRRAVGHRAPTSALFDQIWNDPEKLEDVTDALCEHIASVYQENSPERIYFLILYNIFSEFLEDISEDVLPNDLTGYQDSLIWKKLYNFQRDAATGIINKLETYNGCILADSVGLGKTFTALAVIKYYELRNSSVLVLCPEEARRQLDQLQRQPDDQHLRQATASTTTCSATPTCSRTSGESFGMPLEPHQLGQLRPRRHRRVAQLPQQRRLQGPRDPLPAADAPGHPARA